MIGLAFPAIDLLSIKEIKIRSQLGLNSFTILSLH